MSCEHWFKFDGACKHCGYQKPIPDLGLVPLRTKPPQANRAGVVKPIIPVMRTALQQIQELHKPYFIGTESDGTPTYRCLSCVGTYIGSCPTRKLADEALNPKPKPAIRHQCPNCKGVGKITHAGQIMPGRDFYTKKCLTCGGTGRMARTNQGEKK